MDYFVIEGPNRLKGEVTISGAKNAALPIMSASLMCDGPVVLRNVPNLSDVAHMKLILQKLGMKIEELDNTTLRLEVVDQSNSHAEYDLVRKMRASICVMGPLLARRGISRVAMPGGCAIGIRPIDLHIKGMQSLGANVELVEGGDIVCTGKLKGAEIFLGGHFGSSVTATENVMMAACLADGKTIIESAACEPEVKDLGDFLNAMGAKVKGHGTPTIEIEGVDRLTGGEYTIIPDRIEAGTFMVSAGITAGEVKIKNCKVDHLLAVIKYLTDIGVIVEKDGNSEVVVRSTGYFRPADITTQPYPGFPTDLQAQFMALLSLADGNSIITEKIFPDRFLHVAELNRMGAKLRKEGPTVVVEGVKKLIGAPVMASDLRASAALVIAGLVAKGITEVNRVYHIDRGYEQIERKLQSLGAKIERRSR